MTVQIARTGPLSAEGTIDRSGCPARLHGTAWRYSKQGCRCRDAERAWKLFKLQRDRGTYVSLKVPAIGVHRRIQALMALGWSSTVQAKALGYTYGRDGSRRRIDVILRQKYVTQDMAERVVRMYQDLSQRRPVADDARSRQSVTKTILRARQNGWPDPLMWTVDTIDDPDVHLELNVALEPVLIDEVAVKLCIDGRLPASALTRDEVRLVVQGLPYMSGRKIAEWTGIHLRRVERIRESLRGDDAGVSTAA